MKPYRVVVFDDVKPYQAALVLLRTLLGCKVFRRSCSTTLRAQRWQARLEKVGCLSHLKLNAWPYRNFNPAMEQALGATERLYPDRYGGHPVVAAVEVLYGDSRVHIAFKKAMCEDLRRHYEYTLWYEALGNGLGGACRWSYAPLQPEDALPVLDEGSAQGGWRRLTIGARVRARLRRAVERVTWAVAPIVLILGSAFRLTRKDASGHARESMEFCIAVVSPFRELNSRLRGPDFLLDGTRIRTDNTFFVPVAPMSRSYRQAMASRGLRCAEANGSLTLREWWRALSAVIRVFRYGRSAPSWMGRAATCLVSEFLRWSGFLSRYQVNHFIGYADYGLRPIARNILLSKSGACTWHYSDAEGVFDTMPGPLYRDRLFGYMMSDRCVTWSVRFAKFLQLHHQMVGEYVPVGCLWSEHVRMIKARELSSDLAGRIRQGGWQEGQKIIAVFDSGLADESIITYEDGVAFAQDIMRLVEDEPGLFFVWKEKKTPRQHLDWGGRELVRLYEKFRKHERCFFPGPATSPSEVMAICDLCIGFPYGSPVVEAMGAGVKSIYHAPNKKYVGGYYDRVPSLVTHDYDDLRRRVGVLLYRTSEQQYREYLETHVKGDIDPYLDGRGLTRFRRLLTSQGT